MSVCQIVAASTAGALLIAGLAQAIAQSPPNSAKPAQSTAPGMIPRLAQAASDGAQEQAKVVEPAPEIVGVANGEIRLEPASSQHRTFYFRVNNPPEGADRKFVLKLLPQPTGAAGQLQIRLDPEEFSLASGQVQPVSATLAEAPAAGEYSGVLLISDPERSGVQQDFTMTIEGPMAPWLETWYVVLPSIAVLVFLGSALSMVLSVAFPVSLSKRQNRRRLRDLAENMSQNLTPGTPQQMKLGVEVRRLQDMNDAIGFYSTGATDLVQEVRSLTDDLERKVTVAVGLDTCRGRLRSSTDVPPSQVWEASKKLNAAAWLLVRGDAEQAEKLRAAAEQLLEWTDQTTKQVWESLARNVREVVEKKDSIKDTYINYLVQDKLVKWLEKSETNLPQSELLNLDQECYAARLYLRYKLDIAGRHEYAARSEARLLGELKSGDAGLLRADALLDELDYGVMPEEIKEALTVKRCEITVHPPQPFPEQTTSFEFRFRDRRLNESPLAANLTYNWDFGDGRSPALGKNCVHSFAKPRKRVFAKLRKSRFVTPSKNGDDQVVRMDGRDSADNEQKPHKSVVATPAKNGDEYVVRVGVCDSEGNKYDFEKTVTVKSDCMRDRGMRNLELAAFSISFVVACVLAVSFNYTGSEQLTSLNDYVTPFLWGFGLDQVRDRATSFTELMRRVPQGTVSQGTPSPAPQADGAT
jgi:hypothetical protein